MTILPKKKPSKDKAEGDSGDRPPLSPPGSSAGDPRGVSRRPSSPGGPQPRWSSPPPVDHDRGPPGHEAPGRYEETSAAGSGNKRRLRHRSPPHVANRKQRHDGGTRGGGLGGGPVGASLCPLPGGSSAGHSRTTRQTAAAAATTTASVQDQRVTIGVASHSPSAGQSHGNDEERSGYNSEDECTPRPCEQNVEEMERTFETQLKEKRGFIIKRMGEDGACLFRAVADQVYGDQEMHSVVRQHCVDYMAKNNDFYKQFVTEDFTMYLNRKRADNCHGNHIEMQALSELYNRPIEVYQCTSLDPINTFHSSYQTDNEPIRLSYHRSVHYNSVVDPYKATIGVGLGLPGLQPGLADRNLVTDAVRMSEDCHIEQTMLEDKMRETDWEVTQETIEEQVARESYLQWLQEQEKYAKMRTSPRSASAACSSSAEAMQNLWDGSSLSPDQSRMSRSPKNPTGSSGSGQNSPKQLDNDGLYSGASCAPLSPVIPSTSSGRLGSNLTSSSSLEGAVGGVGMTFPETASLMNDLPPQMFGLSDYDEEDVLARVLAESQMEYLNSLKMTANAAGSSVPKDRSEKGKSLMPKDVRQ